MFTSQKFLGIILILFLIGAMIYFGVTKFKKEVIDVASSPSPSPTAALNFLLNRTPDPQAVGNQPQPTELPLAKNKRLARFPGLLSPADLKNKKAIIATAKGLIQLEIYPEATMAASNFMILAANGFYDGLTFHRVEKGFVIQGGDPLGDGSGGPGYQFPDEPVSRDYTKGVVAMANSGPDTNGSQFFIMLEDNFQLPKNYTIFGKVISGMDVVQKIAIGDVMQKVVIQNLQ